MIDKNILITGASKGLGVVCAKALAEKGARLVLMARSGDKLEEARKSFPNPEQHLSVPCDLMDFQQLHEGVDKAKDFLGRVDVILHVVGGGLGLSNPLLSAEDMRKLFILNVAVATEINHMLVPEMLERKSGNLVHVCSVASSEATGSVGHNTVKAALAGYVRTLGREIAGSGVVATGILPGGFIAPENSFVRLKNRNPEGYKDFIENRLPRKVLAQAEELIPLLLLLCSDAASMMGGCLVPIDAGEGKSYTISL
jgi:NAD(P)-dependent dehydrogenase (short-subunit alcohol dehydrogenase family)